MGQKVVVIGGVACGPKAAARLRRKDPEAQITIIERGPFVSYAGCGIPYYIGGVVEELEGLMKTSHGTLRDVLYFDKVKNVKVMARTEAAAIDRANKTVKTKNLDTGEEAEVPYDKLVMATGGAPVMPPFPGMDLEGVFTLRRPTDAEALRAKIEAGEADRVCIVGAGRIGLEVAEGLANQACDATIVDIAPQVLFGLLDPDMALVVENALRAENVVLHLGEGVKSIEGEDGKVTKVVTDKREIETDAVLVAVGVRPEVALAKAAGLEIGETGAILVDEYLVTSDPDIYAGGDCAENNNLVTGKKCWIPLGSTANRHGRIIANNIMGEKAKFPGVVGTGILRTLGVNVASTGITATKARELGFDPVYGLAPSGDKSHFYPGGKNILIKLVADAKSRKLLGIQVVGPGDVVRRVDTVAAVLTFGGTVDDLAEMDLAYSPPFGTAIEAVAHAANIVRNRIDGIAEVMTQKEFREFLETKLDALILDVRSAHEVENIPAPADGRCQNVALGDLRSRISDLPSDKETVILCALGQRSYEAVLALKGAGFNKVRYVEGGLNVFTRSASE